MKKTFLLIIITTCTSMIATAQVRAYESGDKTIAIEINPIFNYVGNIFKDNGSNNLNISSAGIIYRKFKSPERAMRISGGFNYRQNSITTSAPPLRTHVSENVNLYAGIGTEYRKNLSKWSLYAGWELMAAYRYNAFSNEFEEPVMTNMIIDYNAGSRISGGPGIVGGAEYFLGDVFFLGMEVSAAAMAGYQFASSTTLREVNSEGYITQETHKGKDGFFVDISSMNIVVFRAGVRF